MFASIEEAVDSQRVPQFREFISGVVDRVGMREIIDAFALAIQEGTPGTRNKYALEFAGLLKQYQQLTGEISKDEISRMSDDCIEQMLVDDFGFIKGNAAHQILVAMRDILRRHKCTPFVFQDVAEYMKQHFDVELNDGPGPEDRTEAA